MRGKKKLQRGGLSKKEARGAESARPGLILNNEERGQQLTTGKSVSTKSPKAKPHFLVLHPYRIFKRPVKPVADVVNLIECLLVVDAGDKHTHPRRHYFPVNHKLYPVRGEREVTCRLNLPVRQLLRYYPLPVFFRLHLARTTLHHTDGLLILTVDLTWYPRRGA